MNKSESSLNKHLHDALLNISENDSSEAIDLLSNAGFNTSSLIKSSLDKVESYKRTLEQSVKVQEEKQLLNIVTKRINELLEKAPTKTTQFLSGYLGKTSIQFQSVNKINKRTLSNLNNLKDLADKLDKEKFPKEK